MQGRLQDQAFELAIPRLLRAIREKLSAATRGRIQAEIPKDLLKVSNHDIKAWLHAPGLL